MKWVKEWLSGLQEEALWSLSDTQYGLLRRCTMLAAMEKPYGELPGVEYMAKRFGIRPARMWSKLGQLVKALQIEVRHSDCSVAYEFGTDRVQNAYRLRTDCVQKCTLIMSGWDRRQTQFDDSNERVAKHREASKKDLASRDVTECNGSKTRDYKTTENTSLIEGVSESEIDSSKQICASASQMRESVASKTQLSLIGEPLPSEGKKPAKPKAPAISEETFARAWDLRWNSKSKESARRAFIKAVTVVQGERKCSAPEAIEFLLTFLRRWKADADRDADSAAAKKYMASALNGKCWTDFEEEPVRKPATPVRDFASVRRELIANYQAEQQRRAANA